MILLSMLQKLAVMYAVDAGMLESLSPPGSTLVTPGISATRLQALILTVELPLLQMLVNRAFPVDELLLESQNLLRTLTV